MERQVYLEHQRGSTPCLLVSTCPGAEEDTIPFEGGEDHVNSRNICIRQMNQGGNTFLHFFSVITFLESVTSTFLYLNGVLYYFH